MFLKETRVLMPRLIEVFKINEAAADPHDEIRGLVDRVRHEMNTDYWVRRWQDGWHTAGRGSDG